MSQDIQNSNSPVLAACIQGIIFIVLEYLRTFGYYNDHSDPDFRYYLNVKSPLMYVILFFCMLFFIMIIVFLQYKKSNSFKSQSDVNDRTRVWIMLILFIQAITSCTVVEVFYEIPSIIAFVWYFISGFVFSIIYYLDSGSLVKLQVNTSISDETLIFEQQKIILEKIKFYFDKGIIFVLTLGTVLAAMMTILWGNSSLMFQVPFISKITEAIYMVSFFSLMSLLIFLHYLIPLHKQFVKVSLTKK